MSQRKVKAGEAYVELIARDKMAAGLDRAEKRLAAFADRANKIGQAMTIVGGGLFAAGSAIAGGLTAAAKVFADTGSQINDMAQRTGVATDHLSELVFAAEMAGANAGTLESALKSLIKNGMDPRKFDKIAASIADIADPLKRAEAAAAAFGKAGYELLPMLSDVAAKRAQARDLGLTVSPESAARASALADAFGNLLRVAKDIAFETGDAIAEPLTQFIQAAMRAGAAVASFIQHNKGLVVAVGAMSVVLLAAGAAMIGLGAATVAAATVASSLVAIYAALATPFVVIGAAIAAVVALLLVGAGAWVAFSEVGQQALASLGTMLSGLLNAIAAGDLLNAWGQLSTGMVIVWKEAGRMIVAAFFQVANEVGTIMERMVNSLADMIAKIPGAGELAATLRGAAAAGGIAVRAAGASADAAAQTEIAGLQAQLDALRSLVSQPGATVAAQARAALGGMASASGLGGGAVIGGGAAGTFNAASAGLLGRAAPKLEREAEKQTDLQGQMVDLLEAIEGGIDSLEGFAMA